MAKQRKGLTKDELLFADLRDMQRQHNCSNNAIKEFVRIFAKHSSQKIRSGLKTFDRKAKNLAGCNYEVLHGCPKCSHIYEEKSKKMFCPSINTEGNNCGHSRYNSKGEAHEVIFVDLVVLAIYLNKLPLLQKVFYFPLRERLVALLRVPLFRKMLEYESRRQKPHNSKIMSDVYDGQVWQEFVGSATASLERIVFQGCVDAIPAFQCGSFSLKPFMLSNFSVAPKFRMKPEFMFLYMLIPTIIKGFAQKKYFDYVAKRELNDLYETGAGFRICYYLSCFLSTFLYCNLGISGVKVKIFGMSMDTPGRAELLGSCR